MHNIKNIKPYYFTWIIYLTGTLSINDDVSFATAGMCATTPCSGPWAEQFKAAPSGAGAPRPRLLSA